MKTINRYRLVVIFSLILLAGCMKENESDCGILLKFEFTLNSQHIDKFASDVNKLTIYVFDKAGNLVAEFEETGPFGTDYRKSMRLPAGEYEFVVWGNLAGNTDVNDATNIAQKRMALKANTSDNEVTTPPQHIFYGGGNIKIDPYGNNKEVLISLMDDTKEVEVIFEGLIENDLGKFVCYVTATDGDYDFHNSFPSFPRTLTYIPIRIENGRILTNDFATLRFFEYNEFTKTSLCNTQLILEYHSASGEVIILMDEPLSYLISEQFKKDNGREVDWIRDNNFVLTFIVNYTNVGIIVSPKGWTYVHQGGGIV